MACGFLIFEETEGRALDRLLSCDFGMFGFSDEGSEIFRALLEVKNLYLS